ncbi:MAG: histidine phosphatase family protein [Gemmatimonadaceae bacterium]|nr:histidine phosphatase family protein [Gemmatimonadaceae bacterium]
MRIVIVRHADAGDREAFAKLGKPDSLRPLSTIGKRQMRSAGRGLVALVPECARIYSSPYRRARQTADILATLWGIEIEECDELEPDKPVSQFPDLLAAGNSSETICIVGHEPHLGSLATWLLSGEEREGFAFRKGGACLIRFWEKPGAATGTLKWMMGPKELARLK